MFGQHGGQGHWASREQDHRVLLGLYLHPEDVEGCGRHPHRGARHHGEGEPVVGRVVAVVSLLGQADWHTELYSPSLPCTPKCDLTKNIQAVLDCIRFIETFWL